MAGSAERTDPELWDKVKADITQGSKGGAPDQWSARKAQMAVTEYKKRGGGYKGRKTSDNHLTQWTQEEWGTKSGQPSGETHERYLPKEARKRLSDAEYKRTTDKKRADTAKGKQFSRQPADVAEKVAPTRAPHRSGSAGDHSKSTLLAEARRQNIPGRSRMTKDQLAKALHA